MKTVLFLCTGNYYRSRFAEELFNFAATADCPGWTAVSRGLAVDLGVNNVGPIARAAAAALAARGLGFDLAAARMPLQATAADLDAADHIVALKKGEHLPLLRTRFAAWLAANHPGRVEFWHVHDVDVLPPEAGLPLIADRLPDLLRRLSERR